MRPDLLSRASALSLIFAATAACGEPDGDPLITQPVTITFEAKLGDRPFACGASYDGLGVAASTLTPSDLRFYVSNVRLIDAEGNERGVALVQDEVWQLDDVALLDFEDRTGPCANGTTATNTQIVGRAPAGDYVGIVFDLGVPDALNHQDSPTMPSPLNLSALWWSWQGGYKFMRLEGRTAELESWRLHLGSTECTGEPPDDVICEQPTRPEIRIASGFSLDRPVTLDLATLLSASDLSQDGGGPVGCEIAQDREWNHDGQVDWHLLDDAMHRGVQALLRDLNRLYRELPALHQLDCEAAGFEWLELHDSDQSVLAFLRRGADPARIAVVLCNFTPVPRQEYRIGVPFGGHYRERLNTDASLYGGSNLGNYGGIVAEAASSHGRPYSLRLTLPPLATVVLEHQSD